MRHGHLMPRADAPGRVGVQPAVLLGGMGHEPHRAARAPAVLEQRAGDRQHGRHAAGVVERAEEPAIVMRSDDHRRAGPVRREHADDVPAHRAAIVLGLEHDRDPRPAGAAARDQIRSIRHPDDDHGRSTGVPPADRGAERALPLEVDAALQAGGDDRRGPTAAELETDLARPDRRAAPVEQGDPPRQIEPVEPVAAPIADEHQLARDAAGGSPRHTRERRAGVRRPIADAH